ncbi:hypothetical protein Dimus_001770, partial [Dionaea muscipula]
MGRGRTQKGVGIARGEVAGARKAIVHDGMRLGEKEDLALALGRTKELPQDLVDSPTPKLLNREVKRGEELEKLWKIKETGPIGIKIERKAVTETEIQSEVQAVAGEELGI